MANAQSDVVVPVGTTTASTTTTTTTTTTAKSAPIYAANEEEAQWLTNLLQYLYNDLLLLAEPNASIRIKLVSQDSINIWKPVFTHQSYNPNIGENYQTLEKVGDPFMKGPFNWYLIQKFPLITEGQIGRFDDFYLSKPFQGKLSEQYGLVPHVRSLIDVTLHVKEDVLEAFVGGLFIAGELLIGPASGYALVQSFITRIFSNVDLDMNLLLGGSKNQIKEIFEKMEWVEDKRNTLKELEISETLPNGETQTVLEFTPLAAAQLKAWEKEIKNNVFGVGRGTKVIARDMAYNSALEYLKALGITWDWANGMQNTIRVRQLQQSPYYSKVKQRLEQEGFADIVFSDVYKMINKQFLQLIGKKADKSQEILVTVKGDRSQGMQEVLQQEALKYYAQHGKHLKAIPITTI